MILFEMFNSEMLSLLKNISTIKKTTAPGIFNTGLETPAKRKEKKCPGNYTDIIFSDLLH